MKEESDRQKNKMKENDTNKLIGKKRNPEQEDKIQFTKEEKEICTDNERKEKKKIEE